VVLRENLIDFGKCEGTKEISEEEEKLRKHKKRLIKYRRFHRFWCTYTSNSGSFLFRLDK